MAKKFLLYIHDLRFEKETKKSELVNRLLAEHYSGAKDSDKTLFDTLREEVHTPDGKMVVNRPVQTMEPVPVQDRKSVKTCRHGFPAIFCKYAKPGSPCK